MIRMAIVFLALSAACASAGAKDNQLSVSHRGDGFKGKAGAGWSDADLQSNAFAALCPKGQAVTDLKIERNRKGVAAFTGRCVAG